jgi:hypothetical protein
MKQYSRGLALVEAIFIVVIIGILVLVGNAVFHRLDSKSADNQVSGDISNADTETILNSISDKLADSFTLRDENACQIHPSAGCSNPPTNALTISRVTGYAATMRLEGYDFYFEPEIPSGVDSAGSIGIDTPNKSMTKDVLNEISKQADSDKLSKTSPSPKLSPKPSSKTSDIRQTFYSSNTACVTSVSPKSNAGDHIQIGCAPISIYTKQADEVKSLYQAYIKSRPQYAHPQKTSLQLAFHSNNLDSYTSASATSGYKRASLRIDYLDKSGSSESKAGHAYFYAKGEEWNLVADLQDLEDPLCSFSFPNGDARAAFIGSNCIGSARTFQ